MNTSKKYNSRHLWLAALLLPLLMTGCGGGGGDGAAVVSGGSVPTVTSTSPAGADTTVALNSNVTATFSEAMDVTTLDTSSFTVVGAGEPAITGAVSLDAASKTARFTHASNFTASTVYTATLTTNIKSSTGTALATNYIWSFTSGTTIDVVVPTVSSSSPANSATDVALNGRLSVNFSEVLDPTSVNTSTFTLKQGATTISGTVGYNNKVATFMPASNLTASTVYTVTLTTGIMDLAANPLVAVVYSFTTGTSLAAGPAAVNLRTAGDFVILSKTGITNVHTSAITGNIGASPITAAAMDNVFCTEITGTIYGADSAYTGSGAITCFNGAAADNTLVANAVLDMGTAYNDAAGRTTPDFTELGAGEIGSLTLAPGLYKWGTDVNISTDVTLNGGANDVWIFQISGDIIQASGKQVILTGGAQAKNVFWQVGGGTGVTLNAGATFKGIVLAVKGINLVTGATVNGRLLAQTAVTLQQNTVTAP